MFSLSLLVPDASDPQVDHPPVQERQASHQAQLGQYMTPTGIADFMATEFDEERLDLVTLLDAGAGEGALSMAFARRWSARSGAANRLAIDDYELDPAMAASLRRNLASQTSDARVTAQVIEGDFIERAARMILRGERPYSHAILNPPYKKITSDSDARRRLASVGIETVNYILASSPWPCAFCNRTVSWSRSSPEAFATDRTTGHFGK